MNETERYLRAATRGLWGRRRRELHAELKGHVEVRVQELRLGGLSQGEAERQTLRELGAPVQVSGGMLGVHTLPAFGKAGVMTALLLTGVLSVLPRGLAQMTGQFLLSDDAQGPNDAASYLDFDQLGSEVQKVGGSIGGTPGHPTLTLPGVPHSPVALDLEGWPGAFFTRAGHRYLRTGVLVRSLGSTGATLRLTGWNPVQIHVGAAVLSIQTAGDRRTGNSLYRDYLSSVSAGSAPVLTTELDKTDLTSLSFTGNFRAGEVYTLAVPVFRSWWTVEKGVRKPGGQILLSLDTNAAQNGRLTLDKAIVASPYRLYSSLDAFKAALKPYLSADSKISYWDAAHPAPVLLLNAATLSAVPAAAVQASPAP